MKSAEEFQTMERRERYGLVRDLFNLEETALPVEVEAACYDAAGAIAATLSPDFDLKKISKRDVFLFIRVTTALNPFIRVTTGPRGTTALNPDVMAVHINKIHRYVKGHFATVMQSQNAPATLKY